MPRRLKGNAVAVPNPLSALICVRLLAMLHRDGKNWIATAGAKEQVINLMIGCNRQTRREALLCCYTIYTIMLKCQQVPLK